MSQQVPPPGVPGTPAAVPDRPRKSFLRRHKILSGLLLLGVVIVGFAAVSGGGDTGDASSAGAGEGAAPDGKDESATEDSPADKQTDPAMPGIGDPVRDGKFEFTVKKVKTGVKKVGDQYLSEKAQGQFVLVTMKVENIGEEAQLFAGSAQKLIDTKGREHSADDGAAIYVKDSQSFLEDINPGNSVTGTVVFDIPKGAVPASLELHDSVLSDGVAVNLQ